MRAPWPFMAPMARARPISSRLFLFSRPVAGCAGPSAQDMTRRPEGLGWKLTGILHSLHQVHEVEIWSEEGSRTSNKD